MGIRARIGISFERLIAHRNLAFSVVASSALTSLISASVVIAAVPVEDSLLRAAAERDAQTFGVNDEAEHWTPAGQERGAGVAAAGSDQPLFYQIQMLQQELRDFVVPWKNRPISFKTCSEVSAVSTLIWIAGWRHWLPIDPHRDRYLCQAKEILLCVGIC